MESIIADDPDRLKCREESLCLKCPTHFRASCKTQLLILPRLQPGVSAVLEKPQPFERFSLKI